MKSRNNLIYKVIKDYSKLPPTSRIVMITMGIIIALLFALTEIYKEQRNDRRRSLKNLVESLENCQKSKEELEEDFINYLKEEKRILENKKEKP